MPVLVLERFENTHGDGTVAKAGSLIEGVDEFVTVTGEHAALPGLPSVTNKVTGSREQINNEIFRYGISELIKTYAEAELPRLASYKNSSGRTQTQSDAQGDLLEGIFRTLFMGQPDEEKIKLRDQVRDRAVCSFENASVNIRIAVEGTEEADTMYLIIKNFKVVESGHGEISPATVTVDVASYTALRDIAHRKITAQNAMKIGTLSFSSTGAIESLKSKIFEWVVRYGFSKG